MMVHQPTESAFLAPSLIADLTELQQILPRFFAPLSTANPQQGTERGGSGWTLHQTVAHVSSVAEFYYLALDDTLNGKTFVYPGLEKRTDLRPMNDRAIAERSSIPMASLIQTLTEKIDQTAKYASALTADQLALPVTICAYNRPLTIAEVIAAQLSHLGVVHAAQLANGMGVAPLWVHYSPEFMQRQITRFFNIMSHAYWPEHGGTLTTTINFRVGLRGQSWYVTMAPDGGATGEGTVGNASLTVWTPTLSALCSLMTVQYPIWEAVIKGQLLAWGNVPLAFRLGYLFEN
jgi:hypothetical protein